MILKFPNIKNKKNFTSIPKRRASHKLQVSSICSTFKHQLQATPKLYLLVENLMIDLSSLNTCQQTVTNNSTLRFYFPLLSFPLESQQKIQISQSHKWSCYLPFVVKEELHPLPCHLRKSFYTKHVSWSLALINYVADWFIFS